MLTKAPNEIQVPCCLVLFNTLVSTYLQILHQKTAKNAVYKLDCADVYVRVLDN
jgi:hypothetical protein